MDEKMKEKISHGMSLGRWKKPGDWSNVRFLYDFQKKDVYGDASDIYGLMSGVRGDVSFLRGDISRVWGDVTNICGDVTELWGDVSGLRGDVSIFTEEKRRWEKEMQEIVAAGPQQNR